MSSFGGKDLVALQREMEYLFQSLWGRRSPMVVISHEAWLPPTDVYETPEEIVVKMELAGVNEQDLEVTVIDDQLLVQGIRENEPKKSKVNYHQMGINYGMFRASVFLPSEVDRDSVQANYNRGFLFITLPKKGIADTQTQPIRIKVSG